MIPISQVPLLLLVALALGLLALLAGPVNVLLHLPPSSNAGIGIGLWAGSTVGMSILLLFSYALWLRQPWARLALALALGVLGGFVLAATVEGYPGKDSSVYVSIEKGRGLLLLVLALSVFASDRINKFLGDQSSGEDALGSSGDEASQDSRSWRTGIAFEPTRDRWLVTGAVLSWLWFFSAFYAAFFGIDSVIGTGRSLSMPGAFPPALSIGLYVVSVVLALLSALAFMLGPSRLRFACLISPVVSVLLVGGSGGLLINAATLMIAALNWRKLCGERPVGPPRQASTTGRRR